MQTNMIISDPAIMMGKPVITGTRITVELILEKLAAGESIEQILDSYPRLTREGIQAALTYTTGVLRGDVVYPAEAAALASSRMKVWTSRLLFVCVKKDIPSATLLKWRPAFLMISYLNWPIKRARYY